MQWWSLVTLVAAVTALDDEMAELAAMVRDNCVEETGVDRALIEAVNAGASVAASPDPVLKCYIKCTMEMTGMMSEGEVDPEAVVALMPPELAAHVADAIRGCGTQQGADHCDTAFLTQVCWQNGNKDHYFLV